MEPTIPNTTQYISLRGYYTDEINTIVRSLGEKPYRAAQLRDFLFKPALSSFDQFSSVPKGLLSALKERFAFVSLKKTEEHTARDNQTIKYLLTTHDQHAIETVLIKAAGRNTVCVSTQIGCRFGCAFCMSGRRGLIRNLDPSEIVDQVYLAAHHGGCTVSNVVVMGMGEPFDNYDATVRAVRIFNGKDAFNIGARHITVSTAGVPEGIERFAAEGLDQIKLAISLHAPSQALRERLMPIARKYPLSDLIATIEKHRDAFKRRLTLEYVMLAQVNDSKEQAQDLAVLAQKIKAKINIIPYNSNSGDKVDNIPIMPASRSRIDAFGAVLDRHKVIWTVRKSGGDDIAAACGQLSCR